MTRDLKNRKCIFCDSDMVREPHPSFVMYYCDKCKRSVKIPLTVGRSTGSTHI